MGQVALELSYIGRQALDEDPYRTVSWPYVLVGFLAMKRVGSRATVFSERRESAGRPAERLPDAGAAGTGSGRAVGRLTPGRRWREA